MTSRPTRGVDDWENGKPKPDWKRREHWMDDTWAVQADIRRRGIGKKWKTVKGASRHISNVGEIVDRLEVKLSVYVTVVILRYDNNDNFKVFWDNSLTDGHGASGVIPIEEVNDYIDAVAEDV